MQKIKYLGLIIAFCLLVTACNSLTPTSPPEPNSDLAEPPTQEEAVLHVPIPVEPSAQLATPVVEELKPETETESIVQLSAQHIIDSGRFEGSHTNFALGNDTPMYTTYINNALQMIYHFDEKADGEDGTLFMGVSRQAYLPDELMQVRGFRDGLIMRVIYGSGEEWVREQADSRIEMYVQMHQRWDGYMVEGLGEEGYEEYLARWIQLAKENEEFMRNNAGDYFEISFDRHNIDDMEFWPVEYIAAGRLFRGLQINTVMTGSGSIIGTTYLYTQIDVDIAVVIAITAEEWAGAAANRHINRFDVIS